MSPHTNPQPKETKPSRGKRGCFITGTLVVLMVPVYYWNENYAGPRAVEKMKEEYAAAGFLLEPAAVMPPAIPAEENFGATPLLDGIVHPDDGSPAEKAITEKRKALKQLLPEDFDYAPSPYTPPSKPGTPLPTAPTVVADMTSIHSLRPEWKNIRHFLETRVLFNVVADEPSDVRAVYAALEAHRALFAELTAAAKRPHASFTPPLRDRIVEWKLNTVSYPEWRPLINLFLLRICSAAAMGLNDEAVALTGVLWKLRSAALAESTLLAHANAAFIGRIWMESTRAILQSPARTDGHLAQLLAQCGSDWSPEKELLHTFQGEAAFLCTAVDSGGAELFRGYGDRHFTGFSRFQENMLRYGPSGWVERNLATGLRETLHYILLPLQQRGFATLPSATECLNVIHDRVGRDCFPSSFLHAMESSAFMARVLVMRAQHVRLTLLAIAMERYRLRHGRYPSDPAALVPDCIAAVPPDIDGAPLRIVTSPDGAKSVLYSIGWNLADDWHGVIPATYKEEDDLWKNADWPLSLPFPPLPPP